MRAAAAETEGAGADPESAEGREMVCRMLGMTLASTGMNLWCGGAVIGGDRVSGVSPFQWAFAEDNEEAARWLRSDEDQRRRMWQPRHLRDRSANQFRGRDYQWHCEFGGHPTPTGRRLLPGHDWLPSFWWWYELAVHGTSIWEYVKDAADRAGFGSCINSDTSSTDLEDQITRWRHSDRLRAIATTRFFDSDG